MAYTPTNWVDGEVITAEKLNKLEQGVANRSGYDAEVKLYWDGTSSPPEITIISGDYSSLHALIEENISPNILFRYWQDEGAKGASNAVAIYIIDNVSSIPFIVFAAKIPTANTGGTYSSEWNRIIFRWTAEDELIL